MLVLVVGGWLRWLMTQMRMIGPNVIYPFCQLAIFVQLTKLFHLMSFITMHVLGMN